MLAVYICSPSSTCSRYWPTYVVDFTSLLLVGVSPSDLGESSEKPFSYYVNEVGSGYTDKLEPASGDIEAKEVLHSHQIGSHNTRLKIVFTSHFFG